MTPTLPPDDLVPDCGRVRNELAAFVYGELAPDAHAALERHLEGCAACRDERDALEDTRRVLARWQTPAASEDPRALARSIAAQAAPAARPAPRRARLVRWSALLSGAAAAALFVLSVLSAQVRLDQGRFELSFGLPGARPAPAPRIGEGDWRDEVRTIASEAGSQAALQEVAVRTASLEQSQAESFQRLTQMTREELLRLAQAVDSALAQKQESFDARLQRLGEEARQADLETQRALTQLVNYLPVTRPDR